MNGNWTDRVSGSDGGADLRLTPLLDMFTIVLIFLIASFQAEDKGFEPNDDVDLPKSRARAPFKPAVGVDITHDELLVEKKKVAELEKGEFPASYTEKKRIPPLVRTLKAKYDRRKKHDKKPIMLVQADRELTYDTIYLVLRSAAQAGFVKYRLAIMKK
ncbi:MAG: ExbD/TolR family protein [Bradymonadaceae bacterium]